MTYLLMENPNDTAGYTNDAMEAVRLRHPAWNEAEPTEGQYDWSKIDRAIENAKANGKMIGCSVAMLSVAPDWLQAKRWPLPATDSGNERIIVKPWDKDVKPKLINFIKALCKHVDRKVDYIAMGGLGAVIESYITPDPADIEESEEDACTHWTNSCQSVIDAHAKSLTTTPFIFTAAKPYKSNAGRDALIDIVTRACAKYPNRCGVMNCSLSANSNVEGYVPNQLVFDHALTNPCGLQFLTSSEGFGGHELGGTVEETTEAGGEILQWRGFIEVYKLDADDPDNAAMFIKQGQRLK